MSNYIILDTETTGLDNTAEIVEISVINDQGEVLLDTLIKPTKPIPRDATAIHGITNEMVAEAPTYDQVHHHLIALLEQHTCYIYNSSYDTRLIRQTAGLYGLQFDSSKCSFSCVMEDYSDRFNDGYWSKLIHAYHHAISVTKSEPITLKAHRALADCLMTLEVIKFMEQEEEQSDKEAL
ncbi:MULTISPECIES: 3'-5' exonuclease [Burkholderia cepacia complex]|uniref:3'-5' exonuclease n=1 Tax=Burkholderia cepacia complex TaxID=87882 RepID=UPI00209C8B04|nr:MULTISPECIES: 3'-5' exonuclease [Burkholderia cepacia complex]MCO8393893.1 3'-5' exonuclease [Burkholderia cenocepacia]MCO8402249.1 3'-5' exonuclease [Burkholderia cenocepacia]MCO8416336.1 3'-5' exonuclease [Burkholderia cenocepacia]MCO8444772.1 3'-5' exonuclease [Burkholderia cenocepacia]MCO8454992.1 3'-5' exonuclease [Burkholderia multivorans]